jgi:hypothetical protein
MTAAVSGSRRAERYSVIAVAPFAARAELISKQEAETWAEEVWPSERSEAS